MSLFEDLFGEIAFPQLQEQFGGECTYTPKGGAARAITARVVFDEAPMQDGRQMEMQRERIIVTAAVGADGIETPRAGDSLTWNGHTYAFTGEIQAGDSVSWKLVFDRPRPSVAGGNFHGRR